MARRTSPNEQLNIVLVGYVVRGPVGGMAWHHLQYVLGLTQLGHRVTFLEDSDDVPWSCYDPRRHVTDEDPTYGLAFTERIMRQLCLESWAYHDAHRDAWHGPAGEKIARICAAADVLLDISLVHPPRPWVTDIPLRIAVDTDPVFTQIRQLTDETRHARGRDAQRALQLCRGARSACCRTTASPGDGLASPSCSRCGRCSRPHRRRRSPR